MIFLQIKRRIRNSWIDNLRFFIDNKYRGPNQSMSSSLRRRLNNKCAQQHVLFGFETTKMNLTLY